MTTIHQRLAAVGLLGSWLGACSGSGVGLDSNGQPLSGANWSNTGEPIPLSADFDAIQANVFTPICSVCHVGATAPQGLMLDAAHSYSLLVGIPSTEVPTVLRVKPGDAANSYLLQKLEGHAAVGGQMPLGQTPLPASTIAFISQWITDGAQADAPASAMDAMFRVTAVAPGDGDVLASPPAQIVVGFSRELDATAADAAGLRLERSAADDDDGTHTADDAHAGEDTAHGEQAAQIVALEIRVPDANPRALLLRPRERLLPGHYRLLLGAQSGTALSSRDGLPLTGGSADAAGERIISQFTVAATP